MGESGRYLNEITFIFNQGEGRTVILVSRRESSAGWEIQDNSSSKQLKRTDGSVGFRVKTVILRNRNVKHFLLYYKRL